MDTLSPASVTADVTTRLLLSSGGVVLVDAHLHYDTVDPYAVRIGFEAGRDSVVEWTFGRDLIVAGMDDLTGEGDVRVWPVLTESADRDRPMICLSLSAPGGAALFEIDRVILAGFLEQTTALVPVGRESEFVDLDGALSALLADVHHAD